jgi:hypothetical protein
MQIKNQCGLDLAVAIWQDRLRLRDWRIKASFEDRHAVNDTYAQTEINLAFKTARVRICHPDRIDPEWTGSHDIETTLVHELLHLHAATFEDRLRADDKSNPEFEFMIDSISEALVHAYRAEGTV